MRAPLHRFELTTTQNRDFRNLSNGVSNHYTPSWFVHLGEKVEADMENSIKSPFLSPDDAAQSLNMNRKTLDNLRWDNKGPAYRKHGGKVRYHIDDLASWSASMDCGSGASLARVFE